MINGPPVFKTDNNYLNKIEKELPTELLNLLNQQPVPDFSGAMQQSPVQGQPITTSQTYSANQMAWRAS